MALHPSAERPVAAIDQVRGALPRGIEVRRGTDKRSRLGDELTPPFRDASQERGGGPIPQAIEDRGQLRAVRDGQLGGRRGSRRSHVGREIGEGDVTLVAHAHDHRNRGCHERPHHAFVVEGPQVLEGTAAARQDHQIDAALREDPLERHDHRRGRRFSLDHGGERTSCTSG